MKKTIKRLLMLFLGGILFNSCNNANSSANKAINDTTANIVNTHQIDYPYTLR